MENRRIAEGAQRVIEHLQKGVAVMVVNWPKQNPNVRSGLKNREPASYTSTSWNGHFLPVRLEEVKGKDFKGAVGVALVHEPLEDDVLNLSGIVGTLKLHPNWKEQRGK